MRTSFKERLALFFRNENNLPPVRSNLRSVVAGPITLECILSNKRFLVAPIYSASIICRAPYELIAFKFDLMLANGVVMDGSSLASILIDI